MVNAQACVNLYSDQMSALIQGSVCCSICTVELSCPLSRLQSVVLPGNLSMETPLG